MWLDGWIQGEETITYTTNFTYPASGPERDIPIIEEVTLPNGDVIKTMRSFVFSLITSSGMQTDANQAAVLKELYIQGRKKELVEEIRYIKKAGETTFKPIDHWFFSYKKLDNGKVVLHKRINKIISDPSQETRQLAQMSSTAQHTFVVASTPNELVEEFSHFDSKSKPLVRINPYYKPTTLITDADGRLVNAEVLNALPSECKYTSFEDFVYEYGTESILYGGWEITATGLYYCPTTPISYPVGDEGLCLNSFYLSSAAVGELATGRYILSYWRHSVSNVNVTGQSFTEISNKTITKGDWQYVEREIQINNSTLAAINISGTGYIDELQIRPIDAELTSYNYYSNGLLRSIGKNANIETHTYNHQNRPDISFDVERNIASYQTYVDKVVEDVNSYNEVLTYQPKKDMTFTELTADLASNDLVRRKTFIDGLGRERQAFLFDSDNHSSLNDKVTFRAFDELGRSPKEYLPYFTSGLQGNSSFITNAQAQQANYYQSRNDPQENTAFPYVEREYEPSPLQRELKQSGIGEGFDINSGHTETYEYGFNASDEIILNWTYVPSTGTATAMSGSTVQTYPENYLIKATKNDREGKVNKIYKDAHGRTVAIMTEAKVWNYSTSDHYTKVDAAGDGSLKQFLDYLVYDDLGRLIYEIPRAAIEKMAGSYSLNPANPSTVFQELITYYKYDGRGRLIEKKTPGVEPTYFIYNKEDRLVMSQNASERSETKWSFVKYDILGRIIIKGYISSAQTKNYFQNLANGNTNVRESYIGNQSGHIEHYSNFATPVLNTSSAVSIRASTPQAFT